jgi:glutamate dehydrogenase
VLTNAVVNLAGIAFVQRMREVSRQDGAGVARGFVLADGAFGLSALKTRIDALDGKVDANIQTRLYGEIAAHFRKVTPWFLRHVGTEAPIADAVALYRAGVEALREQHTLTDSDNGRTKELTDAGVPRELARDLVLLPALQAAPDIALLAHTAKATPEKVIALYGALGKQLGFDKLRGQAARLSPPDHWDRLALRQLLDNLAMAQAGIAARLLADGTSVDDWIAGHTDSLGRAQSFLNTVDHSGDLSVAKLMLASSQIQNLA